MNHEIITVVLLVIYLICPKWYISDYDIKKIIRIIGFLISFDLNIGIWIEKFCNSSTDTVQLHAIQL